MSPARIVLAIPLLLATALPQEQELPPPIKVEVDVVNILCSVRDKKGGLRADLTQDDFTVLEDGKPQTIKYFSRETDLPLTLGLLVDVSRSQENLLEVERSAAVRFFSAVLRKKDMAFLISFGAEAELMQDYTSSIPLLRAALEKLRINAPVGGVMPSPVPTVYQPRGTILYDAVYLAATEKLRGEVGRKAMVLITDGVDQGSRLKLSDAMEAAQKADAAIYSIYYVDPRAYYGRGFGGFGVSDDALKKMSEETGGRLFRVDRNHTLDDIFTEIQTEMRSQYAIGFTPANSNKDGSYRRLEVRTRQKDLKVQARKGYYATRGD